MAILITDHQRLSISHVYVDLQFLTFANFSIFQVYNSSFFSYKLQLPVNILHFFFGETVLNTTC